MGKIKNLQLDDKVRLSAKGLAAMPTTSSVDWHTRSGRVIQINRKRTVVYVNWIGLLSTVDYPIDYVERTL